MHAATLWNTSAPCLQHAGSELRLLCVIKCNTFYHLHNVLGLQKHGSLIILLFFPYYHSSQELWEHLRTYQIGVTLNCTVLDRHIHLISVKVCFHLYCMGITCIPGNCLKHRLHNQWGKGLGRSMLFEHKSGNIVSLDYIMSRLTQEDGEKPHILEGYLCHILPWRPLLLCEAGKAHLWPP